MDNLKMKEKQANLKGLQAIAGISSIASLLSSISCSIYYRAKIIAAAEENKASAEETELREWLNIGLWTLYSIDLIVIIAI